MNQETLYRDTEEEVNQEVLAEYCSRCTVQCSSPPAATTQRTQLACIRHISETDDNWQASCKSVQQRNAVMFNNERMADVHFLVGKAPHVTQVPAHKYVLATGSSVFYAMFFGSLANGSTSNKNIEIPDVEPDAFLNLLRYLYYDCVQLEEDSVLATLYAAKKYIIPHLANECVKFLEEELCARNACVLLSQGRLFEEHELMEKCWAVIDAQAEVALESEGFTEIDIHTLENILQRETLHVPEVVVFKATVQWAEAECERQKLAPTPENKRMVLGQALYLIRIPAMSLKDFANSVARSKLLTLDETTDLFLHFTAEQKPKLPFVCKQRSGLKQHNCHRFLSCAYRSNQWRYRGRCDSIQFSVDQRIFLTGFGLYGSSNGAAEYKVTLELKNQKTGVILGHNATSFYSDGSSSCFPVYFTHPIQIECGTFYIANVILDGSELSYFGQEGVAEMLVSGVTFQFQCSSDSTNGTGVQGGQIPQLIFYK